METAYIYFLFGIQENMNKYSSNNFFAGIVWGLLMQDLVDAGAAEFQDGEVGLSPEAREAIDMIKDEFLEAEDTNPEGYIH